VVLNTTGRSCASPQLHHYRCQNGKNLLLSFYEMERLTAVIVIKMLLRSQIKEHTDMSTHEQMQ
jgi:hypothetical protein